MTPGSHRSKLTLAALLVAACALGACGRKAGLDLPPGASAAQNSVDAAEASAASAPSPTQNSAGNLQGEIYRAPGNSVVAAPRGEKKRIPLDAILD